MLFQLFFERLIVHIFGILGSWRGSSSNGHLRWKEDRPSNADAASIGCNDNGDIIPSKPTTKQLMLIRHGISTANEYHSLPGNTWGSPTFRDDPNLVDAPLSENGKLQTEERLNKQLLYDETFRSFLIGKARNKSNDDDSNDNENSQEEKGVELILVSPLTRCLQTYVYGVEPVLSKLQGATAKQSQGLDTKHISVPVLATPLLRERVWAASDIGRPISVVESELVATYNKVMRLKLRVLYIMEVKLP